MDIRRIAVLGAGTMGGGIAQVAALAGYDVRIHDAAEGALARARGRIEESLAAGVAKGKIAADARDAALVRLHLAATLEDAAREADLIVEAVGLYRAARRQGLTVRSSVDCLLAACALRHDLEILHHDRDFPVLARVSSLRQRRAG